MTAKRKKTQKRRGCEWFIPIGAGQAPNPCTDCQAMKTIREQYPNGYVGDSPCQWCPHGPKVTC